MIIKRIFFLLILVSILSPCWGQQMPMTSQSYIDPYIYNPAFINESGIARVLLHARKQWTGIKGAPETYLISLNGRFNDQNTGYAALLYNDVTNIIGKTGGLGTYQYRVPLNENHGINLALSIGWVQTRIEFDKLYAEDPTESSLLSNRESQTSIDGNAGIIYNYKNIQAGFSTYQLFNSQFNYNQVYGFREMNFKLMRHYLAMIRYKHTLTEDLRLDPQITLKSVQGMPLQFDVETYVNWKEKLWLGINYYHRYGLSFSFGGLVHDVITLNYSYDLATGNISDYTNGTHELVIGLNISDLSYSSTSVSKQPNNEKIDRLTQMNQAQYEKIEELDQKEKEHKEEIKHLHKLIEEQKEKTLEIIKKYSTDLSKLDSISQSDKNPDNEFYVVVGAYFELEDAKFFQKILLRELELSTQVMQREDGKYYFVYTQKYKHDKQVKRNITQEIEKLEDMNISPYITGNVWVYEKKRNQKRENPE